MSFAVTTGRRSHFLMLAVIVVALGLLVGCQRASRQDAADQAPDVHIALAIQPDPPQVGASRITVTLTDAAGKPAPGAIVDLRGDMSHAGMRPVLAKASAAAEGVYVADFEWTMAGDWIVTVTATLPDGRTAVRQFDVAVKREA